MTILVVSFLLPVAIVIGILLWLRNNQARLAGHAAAVRMRKQNAFPANARILGVKQGITAGDINRIVHLSLEVMPLGEPPYKARATWFVDTLHFDKIREENIIPVKIDTKDPEIIFPDIPWAVYTEGYEAL